MQKIFSHYEALDTKLLSYRVQLLIKIFNRICRRPREPDMSQARMMRLVGRWRQSDIGNVVCDYIEQDINSFNFNTDIKSAGLYDTDDIGITPFLPDDMLCRVFPHEARHDWQKEQNLISTEGLSEEDTVLLMRLAEADAHSYTVVVCMLHAEQCGDDAILYALDKNPRYKFLLDKMKSSDRDDLYKPDVLRRFLFDAFFDPKNPGLAEYDKYAREDFSKRQDKAATRTFDTETLNKIGGMGDMGLPRGNFITDVNGPDLNHSTYRDGIRPAVDKRPHRKTGRRPGF